MKPLIIIGLLLSQQCLSQPIVRIVLDVKTQLPVSFATIKILNSTRGDIATAKGEFQIAIEPYDTVLISSIGYLTRTIVGKEIGLTIHLVPTEHILQPVTVGKTAPARTVIIGNGRDLIEKSITCRFTSEGGKDDCWPWGPSDRKEEFAEKLTLDSAKLYKLVKVYVPTRKSSNYGPLLLRIYSEDSVTGMPGEELFIKYVDVGRKAIYKNKVVIDLSPDNFYTCGRKHLFLSLGWPPGQNAKSNFTTLSLLALGKTNTFSRSLVSKTFEWFPFGNAGSMHLSKTTINTAFAVVLDEYKQ